MMTHDAMRHEGFRHFCRILKLMVKVSKKTLFIYTGNRTTHKIVCFDTPHPRVTTGSGQKHIRAFSIGGKPLLTVTVPVSMLK